MIKFYGLAKNFSIPWSCLMIHSHAYLFVFKSFCCSWRCPSVLLPEYFPICFFHQPVAILVVVLRIFIPFIIVRAKLNCRFATVYTGRLERTRSNQTHIPSRSISERFGTVWFDLVRVYIKLEIALIRNGSKQRASVNRLIDNMYYVPGIVNRLVTLWCGVRRPHWIV